MMTQRYLLFDSGCALCTRLASDIARVSDGWLMARSLRDPEMKTLLDAARTGWRWEPTLLEVEDGRPRVFTGMQMHLKLLQGVGVKRAWRILSLITEEVFRVAQTQPTNTPRRLFIKRSGLLLAGGVLGHSFLSKTAQAKGDKPLKEGTEVYPKEVKKLDKQNRLYKKLQEHPGVKQYTSTQAARFGKPVWDEVHQVEYSNGSQALVLPLDSNPGLKALVISCSSEDVSSRGFLFDLAPNPGTTAEKFSGSIAYRTFDGVAVLIATFEGGAVVSTSSSLPVEGSTFSANAETFSAGGVSTPYSNEPYEVCLYYCSDSAFKCSPAWFQIVCGGACGACLFGGFLPGCAACAACLAGYGVACVDCCTYRPHSCISSC